MRPIIIKFVSYRDRDNVYKNKKHLKGSGTVITESLTKKRYALYLAARKKFGDRNCWTTDGRIMAIAENTYFHIESYDDLM